MSEPFQELPHSGRDPRGRFTSGNRGALKHGRHSRAIANAELPEQSALRAVLAEREASITADLGGHDALSTLQIDLVHDYQTLTCIATYLESRVMREGPITAKGRTRAAVSVLLSVLDRKLRVAQQLGLARAARPIESLDRYLARVGGANNHDSAEVDAHAGAQEHA